MNNDSGNAARCLFSNNRSRLMLEYLKLWGAGRKTWGPGRRSLMKKWILPSPNTF